MSDRRSRLRLRVVLISISLALLGSVDVPPSRAREVSALATLAIRTEDLLLPLTTVPAPHASFGGRLGLDVELGRGWTAGPSAQWAHSRFRAESVEGESDLSVESWAIQFSAGRRLPLSSDLSANVGPILEYGETKHKFESRNATALRSESSRWAAGFRLRGELRGGDHFGLFAEFAPLVGSAKGSNPEQSLNTTWTSTSLDVGIGVRWTPNPRPSPPPTPTVAPGRAESR